MSNYRTPDREQAREPERNTARRGAVRATHALRGETETGDTSTCGRDLLSDQETERPERNAT